MINVAEKRSTLWDDCTGMRHIPSSDSNSFLVQESPLPQGACSLIFCYYYSLLASLLKIGIAMVLYQYFKKESNSMLPDEKGKLSKIVPSSYISTANKEVSQLTIRVSDLGKMAILEDFS